MRGDLEYLEAKLAEAEDEIGRLEERLRGVGANRYWEDRWRDESAINTELLSALDRICGTVLGCQEKIFRCKERRVKK